MKAWVFVEGPADKLGLDALWADWRTRLSDKGWGIVIIPLNSKANFLKKFGARAAEKLAGDARDVVVGLPDLHPTLPFSGTAFEHADARTLKALQRRAVRKALEEVYDVSAQKADAFMQRLWPSVFRHDFEMLLLAAADALRVHLGTDEKLGKWRVPVEDQDFEQPPKRIIERLFRAKSTRRRAYLDTRDAPAVLRKVKDVRSILRTNSGQWTCPEFAATLKWLGNQTGVPPCDLSDFEPAA